MHTFCLLNKCSSNFQISNESFFFFFVILYLEIFVLTIIDSTILLNHGERMVMGGVGCAK